MVDGRQRQRWRCLDLPGLTQVARRVWPRTSFAVTALTTSAALVAAQTEPVYTIAICLAVYTVAVRTDRLTTLRAFLAALAALLEASAVVAVAMVPAGKGPQYLLDAALSSAAMLGIAAAVGDASEVGAPTSPPLRSELHDVDAHHMAVVSVQAGVADHLMLKQPHAAQEVLHRRLVAVALRERVSFDHDLLLAFLGVLFKRAARMAPRRRLTGVRWLLRPR